ncbi:MAG: hypothetical protein WAZ98_08065 [Cyclobacteriaceae bacterium]
MQKFVKLPLIFFFIGAVLGAVLRWHQGWPIGGLTYPFWLHGHSHIMFLGWVLNALTANFVVQFVPEHAHARYRPIFLIINILLGGMLISFPAGGYSVFSIVLSTLHTGTLGWFVYRFFQDAPFDGNTIALRYARWSLIFFILSSAGPFALGGLAANGMEGSSWYRLALYYYLHFQYNGAFIFGVLALLYRLVDHYQLTVNKKSAGIARVLLIVSCFPTYVLSALYLEPPLVFHAIGFISAVIQLVALVYLFRSVSEFNTLMNRISPSAQILLLIAMLSFLVKLILQVASSFPAVALLAGDIRYYVIAYLHLVFIGVISFFLLAWYQAIGLIPPIRWYALVMLVGGYLLSEVVMISVGYMAVQTLHVTLVMAAVLTAVGLGVLLINTEKKIGVPKV